MPVTAWALFSAWERPSQGIFFLPTVILRHEFANAGITLSSQKDAPMAWVEYPPNPPKPGRLFDFGLGISDFGLAL
jgi:hypothetical protein